MTAPAESSLVWESRTEDETDQLAGALAAIVEPGEVIALEGPLGAGKTRLVRGIATALGSVKAFVSSPTFGLVQHYDGETPIVHIDAYRLHDSEEFERLGGRELFEPEAITLIEWSSRIAESLPADRWQIRAEHVSETARRYHIASTHRDRASRISRLESQLSGERRPSSPEAPSGERGASAR